MATSAYPLSKYLDPLRDYTELADELRVVDQHFHREREQHVHRRFEYALALRAQADWCAITAQRPQGPIIDVGGNGSPFWRMINPEVCRVVDPAENVDLREWLRTGAALASEVYCLSVLEHVEGGAAGLDQFCYHLSCLTAPGGLLFLTCDAVDQAITGDHYHFSWMRQRIFDRPALLALRAAFVDRYHFTDLAGVDYHYPGPQVYDYSFASLALVKRR